MSHTDRVLLAHGSGGVMMKNLIDEVFYEGYGSDLLLTGDDAAVLQSDALKEGRLAFSTDSFVVSPQFFPGGNIGRLAVCGTVNDVATAGATPLYLSIGMILEEGFELESLKEIVKTIKETALEAGVSIVTGDTKVVERGKADKIYINTSGIGVIPKGVEVSGHRIAPGDKILVSGTLGDHGIAIISQREGLSFSTTIQSDAAPLNHLISDVLKAVPQAKAFRDPTRGGLASTLNEFAEQSGCDIVVEEAAVPVKAEVKAACDMLGYDIFQVANEGKMVIVVPPEDAKAALSALHANPLGKDAAIIGEVKSPRKTEKPLVSLKTPFGSERVLDMLVGEQLPRIC
ncbi:MAG: hydrogenase expression/formation protein HypE [Coriobacteriia bacterium]|nr:hydrogenase expression/formation protein HypE [Coriobacteriia bacterium]